MKPTIDEQSDESTNLDNIRSIRQESIDNLKSHAEAKESIIKSNEDRSNENQVGFSGVVKRKQLLHKINERKAGNEQIESHQNQPQHSSTNLENESKQNINYGMILTLHPHKIYELLFYFYFLGSDSKMESNKDKVDKPKVSIRQREKKGIPKKIHHKNIEELIEDSMEESVDKTSQNESPWSQTMNMR